MSDKLFALPENVLLSVFEFAIDGFTHELGSYQRSLSLDQLKSIALVSKNSYEVVSSILKSFKEDVGVIELKEGLVLEDIEDIFGAFRGCGARLSDFYLQSPESQPIDDLDIDWKQLFGHLHGLKRLDLSQMPLLSRHLPQILLAASQCCKMEFLILPAKKEDDIAVPLKGPAIEAVMTALIAALECWFVLGKCGGLRQLTVPTRSEEDLFRCSTQYIEAVIQFCPNIEYLDGYSKVLFHGDPYCDERWFINLETWEAFNASCSALRKFNWLVLPLQIHTFEFLGTTKSLNCGRCPSQRTWTGTTCIFSTTIPAQRGSVKNDFQTTDLGMD